MVVYGSELLQPEATGHQDQKTSIIHFAGWLPRQYLETSASAMSFGLKYMAHKYKRCQLKPQAP